MFVSYAQEFHQSAIDPDLASLNFRSIGQEEAFHFLKPNLGESDRRNDGRLRNRHLQAYNRLEDGGWICTGIDPVTMLPSEWGCFKPDSPRWDENKRKYIKYEHPHGIPTELFCLRVTWAIGFKIAVKAGIGDSYVQRFLQENERAKAAASRSKEKNLPPNWDGDDRGDDRETGWGGSDRDDLCPISADFVIDARFPGLTDEDCNFWQWVEDTSVLKINVTEGAKKTAALLTAGYVAIGLSGIFGGYRSQIEGVSCIPFLIPQLDVFAKNTREFIIAFDNDTNAKTIANVDIAISQLSRILRLQKCTTAIASWKDRPYKGVDDLIYNLGEEVFDRAFDAREPLDNWQLRLAFSLDNLPKTTVDSRYLDPQLKCEDLRGKIIALKSAKGTGKTEYIAHLIAPELDKGRSILIVTHRIQLAKELARRLGVDHISAINQSETGGLMGYALCADSLHPKSSAKFNPDSWDEAIVVVDECEQVFWHMLNSNTCINNRASILQTFAKLIQNIAHSQGTVILSDADLSRISIEYIQKLSLQRLQLWLLENTHNPNQHKRQLSTYTEPAELLSAAHGAIDTGSKVLIHCAAQKARSKYSTKNLERLLTKKYPQLQILRIDSETVGDPEEAAYGCIDRINDVVSKYDIVLASSTIETGISLDRHHFDSVWAYFNGIQTVDAVAQVLERERSDVDRHICITTDVRTRSGNGSASIYALSRAECDLNRANFKLLSMIDTIAQADEHAPAHLHAWACMAAKANQGFNDYEVNILAKLTAEGYQINAHTRDSKHLSISEIETEIDLAKTENYDAERIDKIAAPNPDDFTYEKLRKKAGKTKTERTIQAKGSLCRRYLTEEITDDLIIKDDEGWYPQLQLYYYLTIGRGHLKARDLTKIKNLAPEELAPFAPDINRACLSSKIKTLEFLNIGQFLGEDKEFTAASLAKWFETVLHYRADIKKILGISISPKSTPVQGAQQLLAPLGLQLEYIDRHRLNGKPIRRYAGVHCNADDRDRILQRWFDRDERSNLSIDIYNPQGGTEAAA